MIRVAHAIAVGALLLATATPAATAAPAATATPAAPAEPDVRFVVGGGGVPIAIEEWGNRAAPAVVLIHGAGFAKEYWAPQHADAALARRFHIVAFDLRGHGASGKPWREEDYADTGLWADDLAAVIAAAKLDRPTIVAWSMGGYAAIDYVRKFGTGSLAGLMMVSTTGGLIPANKVVRADPAYGRANTDLMSGELERFAAGGEALVPFMSSRTLSPATRAAWSRQQFSWPVYSRRAMRGFRIDNADLARKLPLPILFVVGGKDAAMPVAGLKTLAASLPHGRVINFADAGHTVSADTPVAFDAALSRFVDDVQSPAKP
ncbi:alpha/beta fold hydrolase [Sphingomonas sp. OK281]|uniref:alpha/beta fold hydrolase n=1 Tax=Sphingomonas sp. OK281 TaxID=1881067 RepID=UPI0008DF7851|nr:alpha/beta hydrolase [Sphingomonas sp. OK281]SFN83862.1 Pimeloyl-ACP methyl ester carboxylesterase [Sphingomonas sp. OK281]